jgi:hypothetical protein
MAGILPSDQETDYVANRRRRCRMVPKTGARLSDENQSGPAEGHDGREKEVGGMSEGGV